MVGKTLKEITNLARARVQGPDGSFQTLTGSSLPAGANNARVQGFGLMLTRVRTFLSGVTISLPSASDFGGTKILDFQNKNLAIFGMVLNAKGTISTPNVGTDLTLGLGTAVAAATPLATTAIDYMTAKTGVGAAQAFTCIGHSFDGGALITTAAQFLDNSASANDLFINAAAAVASGTGLVTFTDGYVDVYCFDLDEPVALT
jgi:hypothetical protein